MMKKILLFSILTCAYLFIRGNPGLDSLWTVWQDSTVEKLTRLRAADKILWSHYLRFDPDTAFIIAQSQYDFARKSGQKKHMARALNNQGISFRNQGEYASALKYYEQSLDIYEEINNKNGIAESLNNSGIALFNLGDMNQAMEFYSRSLMVQEEMGDTSKMTTTLKNIGNVQLAQKNYEAAIQNYKRSLEFAQQTGHRIAEASAFSVIGSFYLEQGDYLQAINFLKRSLKIQEGMNHMLGISTTLDKMGLVYLAQENFNEAMNSFERSLDIRQHWEKKRNSILLNHIGKTYRLLGDHKQAVNTNLKALSLAKETGIAKGIRDSAKELFLSYKAQNRYQQALEMHELFMAYRDSVFNEENLKAALQQQFLYEYKKQKELDDLENEKLLAIEKEVAQRQLIVSLLVGIGLLITSILALVIFNRLKVVRRQKVIIEEQKQKAVQSEKYKEQFLANMSHEIRTPMHAISGMLKILERNAHPKSQNVFLNAMQKSSDNLLVILNDILDLSKIEAGKLNVESISMQPASVIENTRQILQYKAEEKGLQFNVDIASDVPEWILGDPARLNQILTNLAGNAIKFTQKGGVNISLIKKNEFLIYEVRDTGIGIPEEKLANIFEVFEQADESTTRKYGGTGLGLNISRHLVELQGGNIWVESKVGEGSTFFVSLPLILGDEKAPMQALSEAELKRMAKGLEGKRILVAEDNEFNQMIVQDDLDFYVNEVSIDVAENGRIAFEKLKNGSYDLILMDVQMPEMDGYEATMKIRDWEKENKKSRIPILAMTASILKSEVSLCFEVGMDNYVPKPYQIEELIGRMYEEVGE